MTEPRHPGQKPEFKLLKPSRSKDSYIRKSTEQIATEWKIPIPEGMTHVSVDKDNGDFFLSFFVEDGSDNPNFETELAAFYEALDNHRKELARWEEEMAKWNIYQKEMQIERLRGEIEGLKKNSLTTVQKEVE